MLALTSRSRVRCMSPALFSKAVRAGGLFGVSRPCVRPQLLALCRFYAMPNDGSGLSPRSTFFASTGNEKKRVDRAPVVYCSDRGRLHAKKRYDAFPPAQKDPSEAREKGCEKDAQRREAALCPFQRETNPRGRSFRGRKLHLESELFETTRTNRSPSTLSRKLPVAHWRGYKAPRPPRRKPFACGCLARRQRVPLWASSITRCRSHCMQSNLH